MSAPSIARFAARYCECGFALTWSPPGQKGPRHAGWNLPANAITAPQPALEFWSAHPDYGIGALLGPSRKVSLDVDHVPHTRAILSAFDIDLNSIDAPRIVGNPEKFRLMFEAPAGIELRHRTASWPQQEDLRKSFAIFELRAGLVSDAMPPTTHATTRQPYRWVVAPRSGFPALPHALLDLWLGWSTIEKPIRALCPWSAPESEKPKRSPQPRASDRPSVIHEFNQAHDVAAILQSFGYVKRGRRFASPGTNHAAGVVVLETGRVFCHQQGDPLSSEHTHDAFDVYRILQHGGDYRAAVRAAAEALGLKRNAA
ncbi:MAG: bifunctional DNA primase/polymerase [Steroidobacteraceae bacterium]